MCPVRNQLRNISCSHRHVPHAWDYNNGLILACRYCTIHIHCVNNQATSFVGAIFVQFMLQSFANIIDCEYTTCKYFGHGIFCSHMLLYRYRIMMSYKDGGLYEMLIHQRKILFKV